ncbi:MAG: spermidine/putrescine transport system substrate-binding protein, partial [Pseudonocardiales bacterium]|nr:spermidine/putrescine transport system substrate-binding protein [Pseudonocardiales bacterium]
MTDARTGHSQVDIALARGLTTRRSMLVGLGGIGLASVLAACGTKGTVTKANPSSQAAEDKSATEKVVNWSNWPEYIDVDDKTKTHPTL